MSQRTETTNVQQLWEKYEDVAMHFNDLLIRLRTRSLAGVAAISTLVGIFTKEGTADIATEWLIATAIFSAMALFWVAIFFLDLFYYNRLLMGAVTAVTGLEDASQSDQPFTSGINLSSVIKREFETGAWESPKRFHGVYVFYGIVWAVILLGAGFSACMYAASQPPGI